MNEILADTEGVDYILVYGVTQSEHDQHLMIVLKKLREAQQRKKY